MYKPHFVHPLIHQWTFGLSALIVMNKVAVNTGVQIAVWVPALSSFGCMPNSKIPGCDGNSSSIFEEQSHGLT
jgi:hypothetical protein